MIYNEQKPEKRVTGHGDTLAVNSIFHTIQGEGPFAGIPAVFIRLAGCNLQCPMCDTEYTQRREMHTDEILLDTVNVRSTDTRTAPCRLVVITGGEPFRQPIGPLVSRLTGAGYDVQIETNGTLFQPAAFNVLDPKLSIVCSPKTGTINAMLAPWITALKYVATADSLCDDGLPKHALEHPNNGRLARPPVGFKGQIYLQPVDEQDPVKNRANLDAVVASCMRHGYRLCIQTHKIAGVP